MSLAALRAAVLAAAVVLALLSRGDAIVLAVLLAIGAWRPLPALAVVSAVGATAWRWSSTALDDVAGAQAVLGPAGLVDPPTAATGAWLGAVALVLATPNVVEAWLFERAGAGGLTSSAGSPRWLKRVLEWLPPVAFGATAAVVVAGPSSLDDLWIRGVATLVAIAVASIVARRRRVLNRHLVIDGLAAVLGMASLVAVALDAPELDDLLDADALLQGIVIAAAVAVLATAASAAVQVRTTVRPDPTDRGGASVGSPVGSPPEPHPAMPERRTQKAAARTRSTRSKTPAKNRPTTPVRKPRRPAPGSDRSVLWRWRRGIFMGGLMVVATTSGIAALVFNLELPPEESLLQTSFVCAADVTEACGPDNAIASFSAEEDRTNVQLDEVPAVLQQAVLATEDQDYYEHGGVDPVGISRALYNDIRGVGATQGGSTITQQYVKNVYLTSERSIVRKVKEAVLAVKLERELNKDEILERYLNTIYFGRGAYGVDATSRAYYGKDVEDIGLLEASYLAGLIRSPGGADALENPEEATRRRHTVLTAMAREGYISADERDFVDVTPIETEVVAARDRQGLGRVEGNTPDNNIGTKYFVEAVRRQIAEQYGEDVLYGGGLRIYTTLDMDMQRAAWNAVTSTLDQPEDPDAALVAVDQYGYVKAMVGGRDFENDEVNLALGAAAGGSGRGAGSAFKPFVLAEAIRQGVSLNSKFDAPASITFEDVQGAKPGEPWKVSNYGDTEQGVLDLVDATRVSSNTAYAQLMLEVGAGNVASLANRLGISAELPVVDSLVLGSGDVSPLDMAVGYSTFANRGVHNDPILAVKIEQVSEDGELEVIEQAVPSGERVLSEQEADLVSYCLQEVVKGGTGASASFGKPAAGKTGTTQDNKDAWFVGYTPTLTASVWLGYADPLPDGTVPTMDEDSPVSRSRGLNGVTGGSLPAAIWRKFMVEVTEGQDTGSFVRPATFPGEVLHDELDQTTTTEATSSTSSTTSSSTSTTVEETTTTTAPTTTTTAPTTTTTAPPIN